MNPMDAGAKIHIVDITPDHLARLADIHAESFDEAWDIHALAELLASPGGFGFAAITAAPFIQGFVLSRVIADEAEILTLAVHSSQRRRGVGTALLQRSLAEIARRGARQVYLEVAKNNKNAFQRYQAFGFTVVGERRGYYATNRSPAEDAYVMECSLGPVFDRL